MKKIIKNKSGNILVRTTEGQKGACGIVEILHLYNENKSGCVIAAYKTREIDGEPYAELIEIHDRLTSTEFDSPQVLFETLKYGRKLADVAVEFANSDSKEKERDL